MICNDSLKHSNFFLLLKDLLAVEMQKQKKCTASSHDHYMLTVITLFKNLTLVCLLHIITGFAKTHKNLTKAYM